MARCQRFFETLLEVINLLGGDGFMVDGFVVWGRVIGWINDSRFLNAVISEKVNNKQVSSFKVKVSLLTIRTLSCDF